MPTKKEIEQKINILLGRKNLEGYTEETQQMYNNHKYNLDSFYNGNLEEYINTRTNDYTYDMDKAKGNMEIWAGTTPEGIAHMKKDLFEADRNAYYKELYAMGLKLPDDAEGLIKKGQLDLSNVERNEYQIFKNKVVNRDAKTLGFVERINNEVKDKIELDTVVNKGNKKWDVITPTTTDTYKGLSEIERAGVSDYFFYKNVVDGMENHLENMKNEYLKSSAEYSKALLNSKEAASEWGTDAYNEAKVKYENSKGELGALNQFKQMYADINKSEYTNEEIKSAQDYLSEKQAAFNKNHGRVGRFFASILPTWMFKGAQEYQEIQDIKSVLKERNIPEPKEPEKEVSDNKEKVTREKVSGKDLADLKIITEMNKIGEISENLEMEENQKVHSDEIKLDEDVPEIKEFDY